MSHVANPITGDAADAASSGGPPTTPHGTAQPIHPASPGRPRRGIALVTALMVMTFLGAISLGALSLSLSHYREGRSLQAQARSLDASEYGGYDVIRSWDSTWNNLAVGAFALRVVAVPGGGTDSVRITRLNPSTFWVVSSASTGLNMLTGSRARTGVVVKVASGSAPWRPPAAVTTGLTTKMTLSGSATVYGADGNPANWTGCSPLEGTLPGVAAPDTVKDNWTNSSSVPITGLPPVEETTVASDTTTYTKIGGLTWDQLRSMAAIVYSPGSNASSIAPSLSSGVCNKSSNKNWGEPWVAPTSGAVTACNDYFPIIWGQGKLQFSGGRGQGILIVDGDFIASGGAEFVGLVLVRGSFTTSGGGLKLAGALLSMGKSGGQNTMSGSTAIRYSSCALARVLSGRMTTALGGATVIPGRGWTDMF